MNRIEGIRRPGPGSKAPYAQAQGEADIQALTLLLKMHPIPPDGVHLFPDLLLK